MIGDYPREHDQRFARSLRELGWQDLPWESRLGSVNEWRRDILIGFAMIIGVPFAFYLLGPAVQWICDTWAFMRMIGY